jgi:predicted Zn-dependent protease
VSAGKIAIAVALGALLAAPCAPAATGIPAFRNAADASPADEQERRVWSESAEVDAILHRTGKLREDPALTAYVQGVMDRLFPEFRGAITVAILRDPLVQAFAIPDGHIYVYEGLLARFQNEAQLATVMAHEGSHFTHRHGYRSVRTRKQTAVLAQLAGMAAATVGVPPDLVGLIAVSSWFGYSRDLEREADHQGYARLAAAGYAVRESPRTFEHLLQELKTEGVQEPYFFSSHPRLQERIDNMRELSKNAPPGGAGAARADYAAVMKQLRVDNLENLLSKGRVKSLLIMLEDQQYLSELPPYGPYFLAEAHRLRGEPGDLDRAEQGYREALAAAPDFAPTYRALAVLKLKVKNYSAAEELLARYLELAPDAADRKYAEHYLKLARNRGVNP